MLRILVILCLVLAGFAGGCAEATNNTDAYVSARGLEVGDFRRIATDGIEDPANSYAWSMEWFRGALYVGVNRHHLWQLLQVMAAPFEPLGLDLSHEVQGPEEETWGGPVWAEEMRGEIWRYQDGQWERVYRAGILQGELPIKASVTTPEPPEPPIVGYYPESYGYRVMGEFDGQLYAVGIGMWVPNMPFARILRSGDGERWEDVSGTIASATNPRGLVPYKGRLFLSASLPGAAPGGGGGGLVFASSDPKKAGWTEVSLPGFGNEENVEVPHLAVFNGFLYASTVNLDTGFELWKTDGTTDPADPEGKRLFWSRILWDGFGDTHNQWGMTLKPFGGYLYVGTAVGGGMVFQDGRPVDSRPLDVIRLDRQDRAELVVGAPVPDDPPPGWPSTRMPLSELPAGFGNPLNVYTWSMEEHEGWLYLGTMDMTIMVSTILRLMLGPLVDRPGSLLARRLDEWEQESAGADLWKTRDGVHWEPVTVTGFDHPYNAGIRRLLSVGDRLYVGTAAGNTGHPQGGCEVLLGQE